ncbi:ABC-three component system protein [Kineosporia sp. R_H_3]|uniref:ABC-three component system protein n=1 Tax=Kineosporia sp. R_H_3 TaxID=1961848 RepID=UPI000B4C081B|nr:ABC-three component system protein [Kineosporia sp. R_H_3]
MFDALQARHVISMHAATKYHALRFNSPLPNRRKPEAVPGAYTGDEKRYVDQLLATYRERHPTDVLDRGNVAAHPTRGGHFKRQRQAFFRAESLRMYARESTPDGTFEALKGDVHSGVVELAESDHVDGYTRAQAVLQASASIDLSSHRLIERTDLDDRKGICHQLVNDERLTWVEEP